jgi:glutathione reductase (NADPH)
MREVATADAYDVGATVPDLDWPAMVARVQRTVDRVRAIKQEQSRFADAGIDLITEGPARFVDPWTLECASGRRLRGDAVIVCIGGRTRRLPIPGAELATVPEDLLEMSALPGRVAIIGSGNTGAQLATILSAFGSQVTLLDLAPRILPTADADVSHVVADSFRRHGVDVRTGIGGVDRLERDPGGGVRLFWRDRPVPTPIASPPGSPAPSSAREEAFDAVIMAAGWGPDLSDLGLGTTGIEPERGAIPVDADGRSIVPHIFAAGDANGRDMLVQAATFEGETAAEAAVLGRTHRPTNDLLPSGGFTDPDYAGVGLTEAAARERDPQCRVATVPLAGLERAVIDAREVGFLKLIVDRRRTLILGAHAVGENAVEIVQSVTTAMAAGIDLATLAGVRFAYPTYGAIVGIAARELLGAGTE